MQVVLAKLYYKKTLVCPNLDGNTNIQVQQHPSVTFDNATVTNNIIAS